MATLFYFVLLCPVLSYFISRKREGAKRARGDIQQLKVPALSSSGIAQVSVQSVVARSIQADQNPIFFFLLLSEYFSE